MHYNQVSEYITGQIQEIVGTDHCYLTDEVRFNYSHDETEDYSFLPDLVVKPAKAEQIAAILKICNEHHIPVTPRGGGTGLAGSALPIEKGVVISMERFNRIIEIDELNLQATVEPGVITQVFQEAVKEKGLFYPPDPSSRGTCFLGGNLAQNAGGPKAVKYGVTRDYVLNLEVVLPTGEIIWTGANVLKNSTGYNLTQLMVGSEGTLGIITKIVFRLRAFPKKDVTLLVPFTSSEEACRAISAIYMAGLTPSGMEFLEREAIIHTQRYLAEVMNFRSSLTLPDHIKAHLLIELDGNDENVLLSEAERLTQVLDSFEIGEILFAETTQQKEELWKLRRNVSPAVNAYTLTKSEDVVVPRGNLPVLITGIKEIGKKYGFNSVCYGHLGDGNLHVNIMKENIPDDKWHTTVNEGISEIFKLVIKLGGTLSGEHGIGIAKKPYMSLAMPAIKIELMRGIKKVFDPNNILNPGKIF
jgi:glycolate oxidase